MNLAEPLIRRIDPRRPAVSAPQGLRRIVLGSEQGERSVAITLAHDSVKPLRSAGPFRSCTLVAAHADRGALDSHVHEVIAAAALLAGPDCEVIVAVLGACHPDAASLGGDRMLVSVHHDDTRWQPQAAVLWLDELARRLQPSNILLADRDADGELGRRYAAAAGASLACHVIELTRDTLRVRADATHDALRPHAAVMLLARGVADTRLPFVGLGQREAAPELPPLPLSGVQDLGIEPGRADDIALEEADLILAAGQGVTDLPLFLALANELGAAVGASRVAVDSGAFKRQQQIGATGKTVSASGYLAIGISGAVQHLQGIKDCRHVIAVNLDPAAPMVRRADLSAVEDSGALMRSLLALVQRHKARATR
ncbi:electron transfer flavoprotein subunit alpha/FixB family protein [Aquincola sp. S2]|uniref:Electron transfer flavoprotein subunit alpha/FixB family protein n=1 Tax=Pseudaquabacterium terrae TaxID=2732868 RepID=A0ABX2EUG0_9BURK|nr:electron transfer flavoprotein subunit alpha/FixB family protein [Aquabacterium terrae]NRF72288.1 electron transfer flavoprotein subunit alpha/FixB family protein [Aquabacterium terrae]